MRKLIEMTQENEIECDTPGCDYVVKNKTKDPNVDSSQYVNKPCPKCGANLLTYKDHLDYLKLMKRINWLNRWFSWLMIFSRKNKDVYANVKINDGIKVTKL